MRALAALMLVGMAAGAGLYHIAAWPTEDEQQVADVTRIAVQPSSAGSAASASMAEKGEPRVFSPQRPLFARVGSGEGVGGAPAPSPAEPTAVATIDRTSGPLMRPGPQTRSPARSAGASDWSLFTPEERRRALVRDIQKELKRVGCYGGDVHGEWTSASKRAMKAFTDRVNAQLPLDDPDPILLTLVRGYAAEACGKSCPTGQSLVDDGRCLPNAVVARGEAPTDRGRRNDRSAQASSWTTDVSSPFKEAAAPLPSLSSGAVPPATLPGRMTLGASERSSLTTGALPSVTIAPSGEPTVPTSPGAPGQAAVLPDAEDEAARTRLGSGIAAARSPTPRRSPGYYGYAPPPRAVSSRHWTRTIFNDITRVR